jgi:hypothetical protein
VQFLAVLLTEQVPSPVHVVLIRKHVQFLAVLLTEQVPSPPPCCPNKKTCPFFSCAANCDKDSEQKWVIQISSDLAHGLL